LHLLDLPRGLPAGLRLNCGAAIQRLERSRLRPGNFARADPQRGERRHDGCRLLLEAQQAEAIVERGQADLVAVGRQSQYNPNIAHHWAHDLGINRRFGDWTPEYGWWLEKRNKTMEGFVTPTGTVIRRSWARAGDFAKRN
jgi:hypothetical protein